MDHKLIEKIELSVQALTDYERGKERQGFGDWEERFHEETDKVLDGNCQVRVDNLLRFRGSQLFVSDQPKDYLKLYRNSDKFDTVKRGIYKMFGQGRGGISETLDSFQVLEEMGFVPLLKKYPSPALGRPWNLKHMNCVFTNRHLRHIYFLGLFNRYLKKELEAEPVMLDIGSSYGVFSGLVKQEIPRSHHVLVDMPGQLVLAHYYLAKLLPKARIADFTAVCQEERLEKSFLKEFDFVLIPTTAYEKLVPHTVDVVTNFLSFSEMSRSWFDTYIQSGVFKTAPLFFTVNRYDSYPTYHNNITILDYPLNNYGTIYMRTCPLFQYFYEEVWLFFNRRTRYSSDVFQFVGRRNDI
jgi:putative sugar O-methyltransferase